MLSKNTFNTRSHFSVNGQDYHYYSLVMAEQAGLSGVTSLPYTLKILLENLLRHEDGYHVSRRDIEALAAWDQNRSAGSEIAFLPVRVLMQDFTGVPAIVDLAAMRDAIKCMGGDPSKINPLLPVDLVIDHSIQVDHFNSQEALQANARLEMARNRERYEFLRWGQQAFDNFRVVPPDTGICHQVNLEFLARPIWVDNSGVVPLAYPDTVVGTDSHTTMINGLGVLAWGVGGIEAEAAMLGQPISMKIPEVIGVKLTGQLPEGVTATDLVLRVTELLRQYGVVGKFVEYFGSGLHQLSLADRATLANMAPEYGATCGFFPIDQATLDYLHVTGRDAQTIALVEAYAKLQGLWYSSNSPQPQFTATLSLDLASIKPSVAGPKRPQDRVELTQLPACFDQLLLEAQRVQEKNQAYDSGAGFDLKHGDVVIAAITSCTNTSNPSVLMLAGLLAKKAVEVGLTIKPWIKTSLAPGSQVVTRYLQASGLQSYLDKLGFSVVGYGCTTCIGNSGPLPGEVAQVIDQHDLIVSAVLSGNRNFEGRIHPQVKANWLASPPLVLAFALAGTINIDLNQEPLGESADGRAVYLRDIWPSSSEVGQMLGLIDRAMFQKQYQDVFSGDSDWQAMTVPNTQIYPWRHDSTYVQPPPFFTDMRAVPDAVQPIQAARILAILGDSITTDHISPAGSIKPDSPAGHYLLAHDVALAAFNSFGARRGNYEVMVRGTFANIRLRNEMLPGVEGGFTRHIPSGELMPIYEAAMRYKTENIPLVVIAGKEYGTGSSRDWAAKGPKLLGIRVVIAESFERIHRSNLIGMGILPLTFPAGVNRCTLGLTGAETIDILGISEHLKPCELLDACIRRSDGSVETIQVLACLDTFNEVVYYRQGGILHYVLRNLLKDTAAGLVSKL